MVDYMLLTGRLLCITAGSGKLYWAPTSMVLRCFRKQVHAILLQWVWRK